MILADKISELRKKNGWSQEELAEKLGVSRQSVSKWESATSIPDMEKILKMSDLFGVSTDVLLKDSLDLGNGEPAGAAEDEGTPNGPVHRVSLEEAATYLDVVRQYAACLATGVAMCILSPVVLISLTGLSGEEGGYRIAEQAASGIGVAVMLLLIAAAVALFVLYGRKVAAYESWQTDPIELAYGVKGAVEKRKKEYENTFNLSLVIGISLCVLSPIALIVAASLEKDGLPLLLSLDAMFVLVALAVYLLVRALTTNGSFQHLLEEGDYTRANKRVAKAGETFGGIYWCVIVAAYLLLSFLTEAWGRTWMIWPCAGVLYAVALRLYVAIRGRA